MRVIKFAFASFDNLISRTFENFFKLYMYAVFKVQLRALEYFPHPVGLSGLEPPTSRLSGVRSNLLSYKPIPQLSAVRAAASSEMLWSFDPFVSFLVTDGDEEIRTLDPLLARQVLSQLSYIPFLFRRPPALPHRLQCSTIGRPGLNRRVRDGNGCFPRTHRHRKLLSYLITQQ